MPPPPADTPSVASARRRLWAAALPALATLLLLTPPAHADAVLRRVHVPRHDRVVALRFADRPDPRWTPAVLADLARYHDHATFFLEGQFVDRNPALARLEVGNGNEVGNHTYDHPDLRRRGTAGTIREIDLANAAFARAGLPRPTDFRPPKGFTNAAVERGVRRRGLHTVLWTRTLCLEHWTHRRRADDAVRLMLARVRPGDILLAHDGGIPDRSATLRALPELLAALHREGYQVVTVGALLRA